MITYGYMHLGQRNVVILLSAAYRNQRTTHFKTFLYCRSEAPSPVWPYIGFCDPQGFLFIVQMKSPHSKAFNSSSPCRRLLVCTGAFTSASHWVMPGKNDLPLEGRSLVT